jgi:hypothetical protein
MTLTWYRHFLRNGGLNQILKRQTSRFHYGSKFPAVTITVFIKMIEQNRQNSCQSSTKFSEVNVKDTFTSHIDKKIFLTFLLTPYLYTFSLFENPSFIIFSAETEYIATRSWYRNINFLRDRIRPIFYSHGPVACFSDEDDVSGNQNNCYWPLHNESIASCKHHMQEKLVYCCTYLENL